MRRKLRITGAGLLFLLTAAACPSLAQTPDNVTASLREVRIEGQKHLSEAQIVSITGLTVGSEIGRADLQAAADKLTKTDLFDKISYHFETLSSVGVTSKSQHSPKAPTFHASAP